MDPVKQYVTIEIPTDPDGVELATVVEYLRGLGYPRLLVEYEGATLGEAMDRIQEVAGELPTYGWPQPKMVNLGGLRLRKLGATAP